MKSIMPKFNKKTGKDKNGYTLQDYEKMIEELMRDDEDFCARQADNQQPHVRRNWSHAPLSRFDHDT